MDFKLEDAMNIVHNRFDLFYSTGLEGFQKQGPGVLIIDMQTRCATYKCLEKIDLPYLKNMFFQSQQNGDFNKFLFFIVTDGDNMHILKYSLNATP